MTRWTPDGPQMDLGWAPDKPRAAFLRTVGRSRTACLCPAKEARAACVFLAKAAQAAVSALQEKPGRPFFCPAKAWASFSLIWSCCVQKFMVRSKPYPGPSQHTDNPPVGASDLFIVPPLLIGLARKTQMLSRQQDKRVSTEIRVVNDTARQRIAKLENQKHSP